MLSAPRPLAAAIAFAIGIALAGTVARLGVPASACWVVAAVLAVRVRRRGIALVILIVAGLARGAITNAVPATVDDHRIDRVTGVVVGPVVRTASGWGAVLAGERTWVWSPSPLVAGERIAATGYLATPPGSRGPGLVDPADAVRARGAELVMSARTIERVADDPGAIDRAWRWATDLQDRWSQTIDEAGGDPVGRAALRGIAVGDRRDVPAELDARWRAIGIFHVLSVSGLHLAVVAGLLYALLRRVLAASPWGDRVRPPVIAAPIALVFAIAYTMITGAQLATVRALFVIALMLVGAMLDRPMRLIDALGLAAIAILAWRPADLFDPGFQLSFCAALALATRPAAIKRGARAWIVRQLATSAWVTLVTAPITAYHFHQVTIGGVVGNLVLTPAVELVALPLAIGGLAIGWDLPLAIASTLIGWVDDGAGALAQIAPVGHVAIASPLIVAIAVALSLGLAARVIDRRIGVIALCLAWSLGRTPAPEAALRVTFVDVGQGDAALLELPDGAVWLIDAGGNASARDPAMASRPGQTIARVLAAYGHDHLDVVIVSHPHPDHYLGLAALDVPIGELWFAPDEQGAGAFAAIADQLAARGTRIVHPPLGRWSAGGVEVETLAPIMAGALAADPVRSTNDNSLVLAIRFAGRTLLFAGDVEAEAEDALVSAGVPHADIVKVGHHGSPTSSTPSFVAATHPALAVISCGRGNPFHFPSAAVVDRWRAAGAGVARTDTDGTIIVVVDADGTISSTRFGLPPS